VRKELRDALEVSTKAYIEELANKAFREIVRLTKNKSDVSLAQLKPHVGVNDKYLVKACKFLSRRGDIVLSSEGKRDKVYTLENVFISLA